MALGPDARMLPSKLCLWCSLPLSLCYVGLRCWVANNRVLFSSNSRPYTTGVAWETFTNIKLWSPFLHLFVGLYRWVSNPPSLPWYMIDGDPRERYDSILCSNIPLCAHIVSKEALVDVLRRLHIRSNCTLLCVVMESDIFLFPIMHTYPAKRRAEGTLLEG